MLNKLLLLLFFAVTSAGWAQPDTLYYQLKGAVQASPVVYEPMKDTSRFNRAGHYDSISGPIAVKLRYSRGKPTGLYQAFYPNGAPLIKAVYGWGSLHGDWTEFSETGEVIVKGQYRNGKRHGSWSFKRLGERGSYKDGLRHGKWKYYDGQELLRIEKYHRGKQVKGGSFLFNQRTSN